MILMGPSLLLADPEHTTITTSSIARSSMEVNRCGMARKVMFEPRSTHQVDKSMSAFAATVSYWSRAPRLQQRWMPQSILVAGGSLCTLISKFAAERLLVGDTPRCTGAVGEQQRRQVWLQASGYSQLGASPRFWRPWRAEKATASAAESSRRKTDGPNK